MLPVVAGIAASVIGGLLSKGKKPKIPDFVPVNLDAEQKNAIAGNTKNFDASAELATKTNTFNQGELRRMLRVAIPNYDALVGKESEVLGSMLSGELPKDVVGQIQRNSAEKSGAGGYGGSGMGRNLEARDLGLNSLQLVQQGLSSAERWMANTKALSVPGQFDVGQMFLTPAQRAQVTMANNTGQYQNSLMAANVAAAPDPTRSAIGGILTQAGGALFGAGMTSAFSGPSAASTFSMMGTGSSGGSSLFTPLQQNMNAYNGDPSAFGVSGNWKL